MEKNVGLCNHRHSNYFYLLSLSQCLTRFLFGIDVHFRRDLEKASLVFWEQKVTNKYPETELFLEKICFRRHILTKSLHERAISSVFRQAAKS